MDWGGDRGDMEIPDVGWCLGSLCDASKGVFSVFSNDKIKNHDTVQSAWEFARSQEQPEVSSLIRLVVVLFQSEDGKR